jgi:hypothetical protein
VSSRFQIHFAFESGVDKNYVTDSQSHANGPPYEADGERVGPERELARVISRSGPVVAGKRVG